MTKKLPVDRLKIQEYAVQLMEGLPLENIDEYYFPQIKSYIEKLKIDYITAGNIESLKKTQKIISQIENYTITQKEKPTYQSRNTTSQSNRPFKRQASNPTFRRPPPSDQTTQRGNLSNPEIESLYNEIFNGGSTDELDYFLIPDLLDYSKNQIKTSSEIGDYKTAKSHEETHQMLYKLHQEKDKENKVNSEKQKEDSRYQNFKKEYERIENLYDEKIQNTIEKKNQANAEIDKKRDQELLKLDKSGTPNSTTQSKPKYSNYLLKLKETEAQLVKTKRFDEALAIRAEVDQQQAKEDELYQLQLEQNRAKKREKTIEDYNQRKQISESRYDSKISKYKIDKEKELASVQKMIDLYQKDQQTTNISSSTSRLDNSTTVPAWCERLARKRL